MEPQESKDKQAVSTLNSQQKLATTPSIIVTLFWALFLYIVPSFIVSFGFGMYAQAYGVASGDAWFAQVETLLAMTFAVYLIVLPCLWLLAKYSHEPQSCHETRSARHFLNLALPLPKLVWLVIVFSAAFWLMMTIATYVLALEEEPFMEQLKNSATPIWFILLNTCVLAPIVEELVFRGWLFKRFALTQLGQVGAIAITSLLFAAIHIQYSMAGIIFVFVLGLYFTWIRVKYHSTSLAIVAHATCNSLTMFALYYLY
ncbi:CPBP family intramembrane glutamic endopeptidase [Thalassotalea euphylliae]|uniref:CPBP family intramembrane metalloprotease n=1 Tax=Thalassotalea euphylliae TaxID=1655234 RepID=A0A3E0U439_9GAMM|nr:type II CAAX endopeptidase family protein [Thalassotalea euphylliae]REL31333.1 CPBP family intramembrane metalloprotease [Thalassotalea euphylliae]